MFSLTLLYKFLVCTIWCNPHHVFTSKNVEGMQKFTMNHSLDLGTMHYKLLHVIHV